MNPEWTNGKKYHLGTVIKFIPGQNDTSEAVVKLTAPITAKNITGDIVVMRLRYVDARWSQHNIVHLELCDFMPEDVTWKDRKRGVWAESHASYFIQEQD